MTQEKEQPKSRIPEFASREEEAAFWDTHSLADYWDEFKPIQVRFAEKLSESITIYLDPGTLERLRSLAQEKGVVGPMALVRMWIMERLKETNPS